MQMIFPGRVRADKADGAFTLVEVVVSMAVLALVLDGAILGYVHSSRRAEWNGRSLAAQSLAAQGLEQARAAKWDPQSWPIIDELAPTNYVEVDTLDVPITGQPIYATNYISVTSVSANPPLRQIRADCVWNFVNGRLFTNTMVTLRAPDQ